MKRIKRLVKPTSSEIVDGEQREESACPYALASRRVLAAAYGPGVLRSVSVDAEEVQWEWFDFGTVYESAPIPGAPQRRIDDFDATGDHTSPWPGFYITIEVPDSQRGEP